MHQYTLADVINRAIIVGDTRRMAQVMPALVGDDLIVKWAQDKARSAELILEISIHEFVRNNARRDAFALRSLLLTATPTP